MVGSADAGRRIGNAPAQAGAVGQCKGDTIRLGTKVGSIAAIAAFALAAGGISAALLVPSGSGVAGNIITAGHLQVQINQGDGSNLSVENLVPGESRVAYQLVTSDMAGVGEADLEMTISSAADNLFTQNSSLKIEVSGPAPQADLHWVPGAQTCTPQTVGFTEVWSVNPIKSLRTESTKHLVDLDPINDAVCVRFTIGLNESADNPVQGKSGTISMAYHLTQTSAVNQ